MLANLDDPDVLGPGMALNLIGFFYAVFLAYFILLPLQTGMERRLAEQGGAKMAPAETALDLLVAAGAFVFTAVPFTMVLVNFSGP